MTTHSNHLLELTADLHNISVFTVRKSVDGAEKFTLAKVRAGDFETLHLLGVRAASVFLANSTIWVEGITDRWFFRELLKKYMASLDVEGHRAARTEDIHYSFVEYGGGNITHWSFLEKEDEPINVEALCSTLFLIMDEDGVEKKADRKEALQKNLGDRLLILPSRELENMLPPKTLVQVVAEICKQPVAGIPLPKWEDYRHEKIGKFIDDTLLLNVPTTKRFSAESGTIKNKRSFWEVALKHFQDIPFEELQGELRDVARKVFEFIESQNR
jgi:hypothetical protein